MSGRDRPSRRAFLAGLLGGALGALGTVATRALPAAAADGEPLTIGALNEAASTTRLTHATSGPAMVVDAAGPGLGLVANAATGVGLYGVARAGVGVLGSSDTGTGVEASSDRGVALLVRTGRVRFDGVSGVARIAAGHAIALVTPTAAVPRDAVVLLTPMSDLGGRGTWSSRRPESGVFAVHLSAPADVDVDIGWLMLG